MLPRRTKRGYPNSSRPARPARRGGRRRPMRVAGSRVLVTGAGHGLGLAIASAFARAGAQVVATDLDPERVERAVAELNTIGPAACGYALDVTSPEQVADVRARLHAEHGPVDVLVNNAGVVFGGPFRDVPLARHLA